MEWQDKGQRAITGTQEVPYKHMEDLHCEGDAAVALAAQWSSEASFSRDIKRPACTTTCMWPV